MNALEDNAYTSGWETLGKKLEKPAAILVISAHWLTEGTFVHVAERPKTIHDFWGFPKELYDLTYPAPGSPDCAEAVRALVSPNVHVTPDTNWGLDHGAWVVLRRMFPAADIPVFQLSLDMSKPSEFHYELGKALRPLRERGILIIGSGNLVHNLGKISWEPEAKPFDWAIEFDAQATALMNKGDHRALVEYEKLGDAARLSIPTPDHYWPLLLVLGASGGSEQVSFPVEGISHGSIGMRVVRFG